MKWLILYLLKGRHKRLIDKFHESKYFEDKYMQSIRWNRVVRCRQNIRRIEPDFLNGFD